MCPCWVKQIIISTIKHLTDWKGSVYAYSLNFFLCFLWHAEFSSTWRPLSTLTERICSVSAGYSNQIRATLSGRRHLLWNCSDVCFSHFDVGIKVSFFLFPSQGLNFSGADLSRLDLRYINFKMANLSRCNLTYANLCCSNLERADLSGANLDVSWSKAFFISSLSSFNPFELI